jgi:hypothetical protein
MEESDSAELLGDSATFTWFEFIWTMLLAFFKLFDTFLDLIILIRASL